jgi:hypothetical protein
VVAFLPAAGFGFVAGTSRFWTTFGVKAVLFAGGIAVFRALVGRSGVLCADERRILRGMLDDRRLRAIGRCVGV